MSYFIEAKRKIEADIQKSEKIGKYTPLTVKPTAEVLTSFCGQSEAFAGEVVKGGSFYDCIKHCDSSTKDAISDVDYFSKAAKFYVPDAEIEVMMNIRMNKSSDDKIIRLNLTDFI